MAKAVAVDMTPGLQEPTWVSVVKGVVFVLFGLTALAWPAITLVNLAWVFALYILVIGVVELVSGIIYAGKQDFWWLKLLMGALSIGVGVYLLRADSVVQLSTFLFVVGFVLIFRGVLEVVFAFNRAIEGSTRALLAIVGIISVLAGFVILRQPVAAGVAFTWVLGLYALISGPIIIGMAIAHHHNS
ncbi:DUF308 domain-containing protein [Candidatus Saccharibacteria bacterium]|nr:DUF308 domain-containing protein [Candidatus Saccharibacteria bacterium]